MIGYANPDDVAVAVLAQMEDLTPAQRVKLLSRLLRDELRTAVTPRR